MPPPPPPPTLLLVPGAQSTPSLYAPLARHLRSHHLETYIAPLASVGRRPTATATAAPGLPDDAASVAALLDALIDQQGKHVVLIAHSYGGLVATESLRGRSATERRARGMAGGVLRVVYVAAIVLEVGAALMDGLPFGRAERANGEPYIEPADAALAGAVLFNDVADVALRTAYAGLFVEIATRHTSDRAAWPGYAYVETTYVRAKRDLVLGPEVQEGFVGVLRRNAMEGGAGVEVVEMDCGHCPNLSRVEELGEVIVGVLERMGGEGGLVGARGDEWMG